MSQQRIAFLLHRYAGQIASPAEEEELFRLINETDEPVLETALASILEETAPEPDVNRRRLLLTKIFDAGSIPRPARVIPWRSLVAAASILIVLGIGGYFLYTLRKQPKQEVAKTTPPAKDIPAPAVSKATIMLANGQRILLDSINNGILAQQGTVNVVKTNDGQIEYTGKSNETIYNTLVNPRGSKVVSLSLNDGTKVWLNSESSLKYPVAFTGNERRVEITGEAYFEVAPLTLQTGRDGKVLKKTPFIVDIFSAIPMNREGITRKGRVEVLGTHFNINAYEDEPDAKVTLLEGTVKVGDLFRKAEANGSAESVILKPGEQAVLAGNSTLTLDHSPDLAQVMAWKNGLFNFKAAGIKEVMQQLARWYDVDVVYEKEVNETFYLKLDRNTNVSNVFKILEATGGVHFVLEGRKIIVKP